MADQPTPEELIRQKLALLLAQGKTPQPGQSPQGGTVPGTGAAANAGNDPSKPAPPTLTPTTPQGPAMTNASAATVQPKPFQTDEDWAKENPNAVPAKPSFQEPGWKSTLARSLAYGAMEFGRPGEGARAVQQWGSDLDKQRQEVAQYPTTLHQTREKEEMTAADLAGKQAQTAEVQKRTELMGTDPEPKTIRERFESDYRDAVQKGDTNQAKVILQQMAPLYPEQFKAADAAEMEKLGPILQIVGPKPVTPLWGPPGETPTDRGSTAKAQADWGTAVQDAQVAQDKKTAQAKSTGYNIEAQLAKEHPDWTPEQVQHEAEKQKTGLGTYAMVRLLNYAQEKDPRLLAMMPQIFESMGMNMPPDLMKQITAAPVPQGQPLSPETGQPIGAQMPGAPTGQTRSQAQTAARVVTELPGIKKEIEDLKGYLGPVEGRVNVGFLLGKVGSTGDPDKDLALNKLRTDLTFLRSASAKFHINSVKAIEEFGQTAELGKDSVPALMGALQSIEEWAKTAQKQEQGFGEGAPPPHAAPAAGALPPGWQ